MVGGKCAKSGAIDTYHSVKTDSASINAATPDAKLGSWQPGGARSISELADVGHPRSGSTASRRLPQRLDADAAKLNGIVVAGESEEAGGSIFARAGAFGHEFATSLKSASRIMVPFSSTLI